MQIVAYITREHTPNLNVRTVHLIRRHTNCVHMKHCALASDLAKIVALTALCRQPGPHSTAKLPLESGVRLCV